MRPIIVDVGEFVANPIRTGIQRTVRELIAHWPDAIPVQFARYQPTANHLVQVPLELLRMAIESAGSPEEVACELLDSPSADPIQFVHGDKVLVPELFYRGDRIDFYRMQASTRAISTHFIVFDLVPWLNPGALQIGNEGANAIMRYLMLLMRSEHMAFISESVRNDFSSRIFRSPNRSIGPVLPLGSDGLKIEKQTFDNSRKNIVCIGTLDGKKGQDIVFEAFRSLPWSKGDGKLQFVGRLPAAHLPWMRELVSYKGPDVEIIDSPSDEELGDILRQARATIFISRNEGFGLPAVESLNCGIPIVAYAGLPALSQISEHGQIRLNDVSSATVASALSRLRDDGEAGALWSAAETLSLPSWKSYSEAVAEWVVST